MSLRVLLDENFQEQRASKRTASEAFDDAINAFTLYFAKELAPKLYETFSAVQNIDTQFNAIARVIHNVVEKELAFSTACLEFIMMMQDLVECLAHVQNPNETDKNASKAYIAARAFEWGLETGASAHEVSARINAALQKTSGPASDHKGDEDATQVLPQDDDSELRQKAMHKIGKALQALDETVDAATKFDCMVAERLIENYSNVVKSIEFCNTEYDFKMTGLFHAIFHAAMHEEDPKDWMTTIHHNTRHVVEESKFWVLLKEKKSKCGFAEDPDMVQMSLSPHGDE